jgi:hypothetical protein
LIFKIADSHDNIVHSVLRNHVEWYTLYSIIKEKFIYCKNFEQAICLLNAYPELYFDNEIIEHIFCKGESSELRNYMYFFEGLNLHAPILSERLDEVWNKIQRYWHIHHPDKHMWYDKLSQQISIKLCLNDKKSKIINFMQKNPNSSPKAVFTFCKFYIYKHKFATLNQQPNLSQIKYSQINHLRKEPRTAKRLCYNQPTSHKHQCHNYRK